MKRDKPNPPLRSIAAEARDCRNAWRAYRAKDKWKDQLAWCLHHATHCSDLYEDPFNRIRYILELKPRDERASRLRSFRPVKGSPKPPMWQYQPSQKLRAIHDQQWPDNTWTGQSVLNT